MRYFVDFDRTVFDTESFKRAVRSRPPIRIVLAQLRDVIVETLGPSRSLSKRRIFERTIGTYMSHGRLTFLPQELKEYLYPDAVAFLERYGKETTIVTYGVRAFITAKVTSALSHLSLNDIVYTPRRKGRTIRRLCESQSGPCTFVDDAVFQLESVSRACPDVALFEIRRDGGAGDGRWPVLRSFDELPGLVPSVRIGDIDLKTARVAGVLNTASGTCDAASEEAMRTILREAGIEHPRLWCGGSEQVAHAFKEARAYNPDILIVLGGDGTIRTGAEACTKDGPLLIPLPGGTMNVLPKALYGDRSWQDALRDTLLAPQTKQVSGGEVAGRQFFIAAILGAPALWTHTREALREGNIPQAISAGVEAFQSMAANTVSYAFTKDTSGTADAVVVICPLISTAMDEHERALEAAAVTLADAGEVLTLASSAAFGAWRDAANVSVVKTPSMRVWDDTDVPVILDGEAVDLGKEVTITFIPHAFTVVVPADTPESRVYTKGL